MPGYFYTMPGVLYNTRRFLYNARSSIQCSESSIQCPEFYRMPVVLQNARSSIQCPEISIEFPEFYTISGDFFKKSLQRFAAIQGPLEQSEGGFFDGVDILGLISEKSFSLNSPFKCLKLTTRDGQMDGRSDYIKKEHITKCARSWLIYILKVLL